MPQPRVNDKEAQKKIDEVREAVDGVSDSVEQSINEIDAKKAPDINIEEKFEKAKGEIPAANPAPKVENEVNVENKPADVKVNTQANGPGPLGNDFEKSLDEVEAASYESKKAGSAQEETAKAEKEAAEATEDAADAQKNMSAEEIALEKEKVAAEKENTQAQADAEKAQAKQQGKTARQKSRMELLSKLASTAVDAHGRWEGSNGLIIYGLVLHFVFKGLLWNWQINTQSMVFDYLTAIALFLMWCGLFEGEIKPQKWLAAAYPVLIVLGFTYALPYFLSKMFPALAVTQPWDIIFKPQYWPWWALLGTVRNPDLKLARIVRVVWIFAVLMPILFILLQPTPLYGAVEDWSGDIMKSREAAAENEQTGFWEWNINVTKNCIFGDTDACTYIGTHPEQIRKEREEKETLSTFIDKRLPVSAVTMLVAYPTSITSVDESRTINAFIDGYGTQAAITCGKKGESANGKITSHDKGIVNLQGDSVLGSKTTVTCDLENVDLDVGSNQIIFTAVLGNLPTESYYDAYLISDEAWKAAEEKNSKLIESYENKIRMMAQSRQITESAVRAEREKLYKQLFPEVIDKFTSKSPDDFAIVTLETSPLLAAVSENKNEIQAELAVQNNRIDGKINKIWKITLDVPNYWMPKEGECPLLDRTPVDAGASYNTYKVDLENLKYDWTKVKMGEHYQKKLPACTFQLVDPGSSSPISNEGLSQVLNNPTSLSKEEIVASMVYDYQLESTAIVTVMKGASIQHDWLGEVVPTSEVQRFIMEQARIYGVHPRLALGVASVESGFKQEKSNIGEKEESYGIFQINKNAHPQCYEENDIVTQCMPTSCGVPNYCYGQYCEDKTPQTDWKCNVETGIRLLVHYYSQHGLKPEGVTTCGRTYTDWDAALRAYNGLGPECDTEQKTYVERVHQASLQFA